MEEAMSSTGLGSDVNSFRSFNRFYTKQIGLLNRGMLQSQYSLTHVRILFELSQSGQTTASALIDQLGIDRGYLSRILKSFEKEDLITSVRSKKDSRQILLSLTASGRKAFGALNTRSTVEARGLLKSLTPEDRRLLIESMQSIQDILDPKHKIQSPITFRTHRPGDIGWIAHRHGVLYSREYGWNETFEALVAEILVNFVKKHNPQRERLWIAEQDGNRIGSIMLVDAGEGVSQLRLLLVEPAARGQGLGKKLVRKCMDFSRKAGYHKMKLWTQSNLHAARKLYADAGWKLALAKPHNSFGAQLVSEFWEYEEQPRSHQGTRSSQK